MSEHKIKLAWKRTTPNFDYNTYNRDHTWEFDNGLKVSASAAVEYKGNPACVDPEETLVAAIAGCHMLTFLAIASKKGYVVDQYADSPVGILENDSEGIMRVTRATLKPKITFSGGKKPGAEDLKKLHEKAHEHCFIANSVRTQITVET